MSLSPPSNSRVSSSSEQFWVDFTPASGATHTHLSWNYDGSTPPSEDVSTAGTRLTSWHLAEGATPNIFVRSYNSSTGETSFWLNLGMIQIPTFANPSGSFTGTTQSSFSVSVSASPYAVRNELYYCNDTYYSAPTDSTNPDQTTAGSSFTISSLGSDTLFDVWVRSYSGFNYNSYGWCYVGQTRTLKPPLGTPGTPTWSVTNQSTRVVTVSWYYAQNAEGYRVVTQFGTDVKTTATSIDLVLPTYGDSYWVQVAAYRGTEESAWTSPVYMSVTNPTPPPPIPTNPKAVIFDKYSMYVTASWDAASGADGYLVYSSTNGQDFTTHGTSNLLLLPKYDTSYYFTVRSYKFYNTTQVNSNPTTAVYFSIPKPPPRQPTDVAYTVMDVKLKQIKVTWSEDDVLTEASDIYLSDANGIIDYSLDNTWGYAAFNLPAYATNYYVYVKSYNHLNGVKQYSDPSATITINVKNPKPAPWQWSYNMYSGGPLASTVTYIENSKRYYKGYLMSADEWNAFTKRINDFREYKIGTGQIYTFTTVYPEGTPTKEILNEAAGAINGIPGCSVPYLSIGSTLSASFMNSLRDALNSIT